MLFPLQEWLRERVSMSRYTYSALLAAQCYVPQCVLMTSTVTCHGGIMANNHKLTVQNSITHTKLDKSFCTVDTRSVCRG